MNTILLLDDQPITNFITRKVLEVEGVRLPVIDFTNPHEAINFLKNDYDVVMFLDLNMPEMSGWDVMDILLKINATPRIIILTSSTSELDRERANKYTFVIDYVIKPLTRIKLTPISSFLNDTPNQKA